MIQHNSTPPPLHHLLTVYWILRPSQKPHPPPHPRMLGWALIGNHLPPVFWRVWLLGAASARERWADASEFPGTPGMECNQNCMGMEPVKIYSPLQYTHTTLWNVTLYSHLRWRCYDYYYTIRDTTLAATTLAAWLKGLDSVYYHNYTFTPSNSPNRDTTLAGWEVDILNLNTYALKKCLHHSVNLLNNGHARDTAFCPL